jgi:hypothetical protein
METFDLDTPIDVHGTARERFDIHRRRVWAIAQVLTVGRQVLATDGEMGQLVGMKNHNVALTRRLMIAMRVLEYRPGGGHNPGAWKLLVADAELLNAIEMEQERQMRGGLAPEGVRTKASGLKRTRKVTRQSQEQVAVHEDRLGLPVGAVVGPEPINPLRTSLKGEGPDAAGALVLAAKQYARKDGSAEQRKAAQLVKELNEIGVSVPPDLAAKAVIRKDDRLEAIGLVLPYIEALEKKVYAQEAQLREQADYGSLRQKVEKQHQQIERLVAGRTAEAMRSDPNGPRS